MKLEDSSTVGQGSLGSLVVGKGSQKHSAHDWRENLGPCEDQENSAVAGECLGSSFVEEMVKKQAFAVEKCWQWQQTFAAAVSEKCQD